MVRKSKGFRYKSRKKLKLHFKCKFKPSIFLKEFKEGEKVVINCFSQSQKGMPHPRFKGKIGVVIGKRGRAYVVRIKDGGNEKILISFPEHLKVLI